MTDFESRETSAWALLTVRAQQWISSPSDHEGLSSSEVAGMLASPDRNGKYLSHRAYMAGILCKAGDWSLLRRVSRELHSFALDLATREQWDLRKGPGPLWSLTYLALLECTGPSISCPVCEGLGSKPRMREGERRSCDLCEGTGRLPRTQRTRAELLGVDERNWRRVWKDRYRGIYTELQNWISDASRHLAQQLSMRKAQSR